MRTLLPLIAVVSASLAGGQQVRPPIEGPQPPIVDLTTSLGRMLPGRRAQARTLTTIPPRNEFSSPGCAVAGAPAGVSCARVCVRIPWDTEFAELESFAADRASPGNDATPPLIGKARPSARLLLRSAQCRFQRFSVPACVS
jgi:hypothetical protein